MYHLKMKWNRLIHHPRKNDDWKNDNTNERNGKRAGKRVISVFDFQERVEKNKNVN